MFEAEPRHLSGHVTKLTPLLICNCPQPVRNTTLGFRGEKRKATYAVCILKPHSCLHSWSPSVCYSTRSGFHEFCFRCNNLILVGQPRRWKRQTAQNGLSLLVSLAKGLCPSCLHLQRNTQWMCEAPRSQLHTHILCVSLPLHRPISHCSLHFWIKKHMLPTWYLKVSCQSSPSPLRPHTSWQDALRQIQLHMLILKNRWKWNHCDFMMQSRQRQPRVW